MRAVRLALPAALLFAAVWASAASDAEAKPARCGTKQLYGKTLRIVVVGDPLPCAKVRRIIRGRCRSGRRWSCFSFRTPDPLLVWFRSRERFRPKWSTTIEARRYPCREARVTARAWRAARRSNTGAFPDRMQVLADDLKRCGQLRGKTYAGVRRLLGRPDETSVSDGRRYADWDVGAERDSFFQVDNEYFSLTFGTDGVLESVTFEQG